MGIFSNTLGGGRKNKPKTGGIFANTLSRWQQPAQQPYHTSVDSRGNSMGFSDERDTSGRPFFAYRNPGDTATTTDRTRVATRFDPRRPASQTRDSFYNPRDTRIGDSDKKTQIDHKIALALSGSNNPANLRTVLNAQNNDSDIIRDLQGNVIAGRNSLFQAQSDLAIEKKTPLPFTGTRYGQFALEAKQAQEEAKRANSLGGLFKNTLLGLPKALKDILLPTRGYSDSELSQAKPTFKQTLLGVPKVAAEISSALGELLGSSGTSIAANFSQTKIGGKLADAGDKIRDFSVPKNAEEAKAMRIADVASFIPIGSVNATTRVVVSQIAKEKSPIVIKYLLKKIGDYSDDIIEALVRADTVDEVTSVLRSNRTIRQVEFSETANLLPAKEAVAKGLTEEQYVKGQGTPVYHGTQADFEVFAPKSPTERMAGKAGTFFTTNPTEALGFGKNVKESYISPTAKVKIEYARDMSAKIRAERLFEARREGYDVVQFRSVPLLRGNRAMLDKTKAEIEKMKPQIDALNQRMLDGKITPEQNLNDPLMKKWSALLEEVNPTHTVVFNSGVIKTTSQLRTEYQTAKGTLPKATSAQQAVKDGLTEDGLSGLAQEARKYPNAEEFERHTHRILQPGKFNELGDKTPLLLYRGSGGEAKVKFDYPVLGKGNYAAFSSDVALQFGKNIEKVIVQPQKPLVINNDTQYRLLTRNAGMEYPNTKGYPLEKVRQETDKLNNYIKSQGYDSVIITIPSTEGRGKLLKSVFTDNQVFILDSKIETSLNDFYNKAVKGDSTAQLRSKPSSDFIGEPKKSGKQLAKEEVDNMFAERERKVAREYVERKTTNRAEYDPGYFARKETLENNLKTTRQIEKQTKPPQISQQSSQTIPNSKALVGRTMSEGEAKSIEIQAKQAIDIMDGAKIPDGVSLHKIISDTATPVTKKVNFIDTFLRTPDRVMNKIGFGKEAVELRRAMDSYWKELPKNIAKHTEWAKRVPKESNERIFKYLDGQAIDLRPDEKQVALEVRVYLAQWADRLGLAKDQRVSEYITRLFDEELLAKEFPEELAKLIADKVPGSVYNPFMLRRLGAKGYKQDTWAALDAYVKRATRKVHMDPVLEKIQTKSGQSLEMANIEKTQFKFIQRYIENINMRPTDLEESFDNAIKSSFVGYKFGQRPVASVTQFLRRVSFRGSIGLNPTSALRNLSQGVNTYAVLGEKYTTIGYASLFKKGAKEELELEGILNAGFIQDRVISSTQKTIEVMDKGLFAMFQTAEFINRGAAYFGAKSKALSEGKTMGEAIEYAKGIVRKTQFAFDSVDTPVGMSSNIAKTAMQFQTFTMKQMEFLGGMAKDSVTGKEKAKNVIGLLRYATAGLVFVYTVGQVFNMKEKELIPVYRLGVPAALKPIVEAGKAALDLPDKYGNQRSLKEKIVDVAKSAIGYIPGGSQIKKTVEGVAANNSGGSFDKGGNLQFKVGETLPQKIQAGIFGKYAAPQAEKYFNRAEEAKKLDAEAERTYYELLALPESEGDQRFTQLEKDNPKLAGKIKVIGRDLNLGITEKDRELRAFGVTNGDRAQRVLDYILELPSEADQDKLYDELVRKRIITSVVAKQIQELMQSR